MRLGVAIASGLVALLATAAGAGAQTPIVAARVPGSGPIADPLAAVWKDARPVAVTLLPQTVTLPHRAEIAVTALTVRAVHNGGWLAFLAFPFLARKQCSAREIDAPHGINLDHLDHDLVAERHDIFDARDVIVCELADAHEPVLAVRQLDERTEVDDARHLAVEHVTDLDVLR